MSLKAFMDESSDEKSEKVLVLAGYISNAESWAKFSDEWNNLSKRKYRNREFHLNEMKLSDRKFQEYYSIVQDHVLASVGVILNIENYLAALAEAKCRPDLEFFRKRLSEKSEYYYFASRIFLHYFTHSAHEIDIDEKVDFIFDDFKDSVKLIEGWKAIKDNESNEGIELIGSVTLDNSADIMPLQAADLIAGLIQRHYKEAGYWRGEIPPTAHKREVKGLFFEFGKEAIREQLEFILNEQPWDEIEKVELEDHLIDSAKKKEARKAKRAQIKALKSSL